MWYSHLEYEQKIILKWENGIIVFKSEAAMKEVKESTNICQNIPIKIWKNSKL
jgi:hypothetical protein